MLLKCFLTTQASADPSRPGLLALVLHLIHKWAHLGDTRDLCTKVQATPQALTGISPGGWDGRNGGLLLSSTRAAQCGGFMSAGQTLSELYF